MAALVPRRSGESASRCRVLTVGPCALGVGRRQVEFAVSLSLIVGVRFGSGLFNLLRSLLRQLPGGGRLKQQTVFENDGQGALGLQR
jgi:hypothetical protein